MMQCISTRSRRRFRRLSQAAHAAVAPAMHGQDQPGEHVPSLKLKQEQAWRVAVVEVWAFDAVDLKHEPLQAENTSLKSSSSAALGH